MYSHVCGQMVFVFGAEATTWTVESFGQVCFVDKQMSVQTTFVVEFLVTLVAMKDFVGVQDLVEFHAVHGRGSEIAAFSRAVKQCFLRMDIVVIQQNLQLGRFKGATRLHTTEWRLKHVGVTQVLVQAHLSLAAMAADWTPMQVAFLLFSTSRACLAGMMQLFIDIVIIRLNGSFLASNEYVIFLFYFQLYCSNTVAATAAAYQAWLRRLLAISLKSLSMFCQQFGLTNVLLLHKRQFQVASRFGV